MGKFDKLKQRILNSKTEIKLWQKIATILCCFTVFTTIYALVLPAITLSLKTYCNEQHEHTDECYIKPEEYSFSEDDDLILICSEEHEHVDDCYLSLENDLNSVYWENMADSNDLVEVANSQVGYVEYQGYSLYGALYQKDSEYPFAGGDWNSLFVKFCLDKANISDEQSLFNADNYLWVENIYNNNRLLNVDGTFIPEAGNLVFKYDENLETYLVGVAVKVDVDNEIVTAVFGGVYNEEYDNYLVEKTDLDLYDFDLCFFSLDEETKDLSEPALLSPGDYNISAALQLHDKNGDGDDDCVYNVYVTYTDKDGNKHEIKPGEEVNLVGNEYIETTLSYRVKINDVKGHDNTIYYEMPDWMIEHDDVQDVTFTYINVNNVIGTLYAEDGKAVIVFKEGFENTQGLEHNDHIEGDITIGGYLDWKEISTKPGPIKIGDREYNVNLPTDVNSQLAGIHVDKTISKLHEFDANDSTYGIPQGDPNYGKSYIEYTIQVKVDNDADLPNVKVVDYLANNGTGKYINFSNGSVKETFNFIDKYIEGIAGVTGTVTTVAENDLVSTTKDGVDFNVGSVYISHEKSVDAQGNIANANSAVNGHDSLVWDLGTAEKNKVYTLTYKLIVKDEYLGFAHGTTNDADGGVIQNQADLYSDKYIRDHADENFTPKCDLEIYKESSAPVYNETLKKYVIDYTVVIYAPLTNDYTMNEVKFNDIMETSGVNTNYIKYLAGANGSTLKLYEGGMVFEYDHETNEVVGQHIDTTEVLVDANRLSFTDPSNLPNRSTNPEIGSRSMAAFIGDLKPGESKTLTYQVEIDVEAFLNSNSGNANIKNTAQAYDDEVKSPERWGTLKDSDVENNSIALTHWNGKVSGAYSNADRTINITSNNLYNSNGSAFTGSKPESFTVLGKNQEYKVVVNQNVEWNMVNTDFKDQISDSSLVRYSGWVRIHSFDVTEADKTAMTNKSDAQVFAYLEGKTPAREVWVNVDNLATFTYKMSTFGFANEKQAYTLHYFTELTDKNIAHVSTGNNFTTSGNVGYGDGITLKPITTTSYATFMGNNNYSFKKYPWYYDDGISVNREYFDRGELYWVLKVTSDGQLDNGNYVGGKLTKGTQIRDYNNAGSNNVLVNEHSFVGAYVGANIDSVMDNYSTLSEFENAYTKLTSGFSITYPHVNSRQGVLMEVTADDGITINTDMSNSNALYVVIKSNPSVLPIDNNVKTINYTNVGQMKPAGVNAWDEPSNANQTINLTYGISKDAQGVYLVNNTNPPGRPASPTSGYDISVQKINANGTKSNISQGSASNSEFLHWLSKDFPVYTFTGKEYVNNNNGNTYVEGWKIENQKISGSAKHNWALENGIRYMGNYEYESGTYVAWTVKLNEQGDMTSGAYSIVDTIPEGLELAYVRTSSIGNNSSLPGELSGARNSGVRSGSSGWAEDGWKYNVTARLDEWETNYKGVNNPWNPTIPIVTDDGWQAHVVASRCDGVDNNYNDIATYYYTKDNKVQIYCPYITSGRQPISFQVVCKVTDSDVLLGGMEKTFVNTAQLYSGTRNSGTPLSTVQSPITVQVKKLSKENITPANNGAILDFEIEVNELNEQLNTNGSTITLIDELSSSLIINIDSIQIKKVTKTGEVILPKYSGTGNVIENPSLVVGNQEDSSDDSWFASFDTDNNSIRIVMPDKTHLKIAYKATVNVAPDTNVSISNVAYFEGYPDNADKVEEKEFSYNIQNVVNRTLEMRLSKYDTDTLAALPGATFAAYEIDCNVNTTDQTIMIKYDENGKPLRKSDVPAVTGTTGSSGVLVFAQKDQSADLTLGFTDGALSFDKVYEIKEISSPDGYMLDQRSIYTTVLKVYPGGRVYRIINPMDGLITGVGDADFKVDAFNHTGWATIVKEFGDQNSNVPVIPGTYKFGLYEESQMNAGKTEPSTNESPKQVVEIDISHEEAQSGIMSKSETFKKLNLDENYYIFEIDDQNNPIIPDYTREDKLGVGIVSGRLMNVFYNTNLVKPVKTGDVPQVIATNKIFKASMTKKFESAHMMEGAITGEYWFGMYEAKLDTNTNKYVPDLTTLVKKKLEWTQNESTTVFTKGLEFTDLRADKYYFIFELNDNDQPILVNNSEGIINNKHFVVSYDGTNFIYGTGENAPATDFINNLIIPSRSVKDDGILKVSITNTINYYQLPKTGGNGNKIFTISGLFLLTISIVEIRKRKNKK